MALKMKIRSPSERAYSHLNLMCNPFGEIPLEERAELAVADVDRLMRNVGKTGFALQLIGESGSGKTSHLLAICARFPEATYVSVPMDGKITIPEDPLLIVDEVQHLSKSTRHKLFTRYELSLVLGTHQDFSEELGEADFTVHNYRPADESSIDRIGEIFDRRLEWARRDSGPIPRIPRSTLKDLMRVAGKDIRKMEGILYRAVQEAGRPGSKRTSERT